MSGNKNELVVIATKEILGKEFKIYGTIENPLFLAKDVANMLEHTNVTKMLNSIDTEEKVVIKIPTNYLLEGLQSNTEYTFLTEDGLYETFMLSRKPKAKQFKKEVKAILKQLRLTGIVMTEENYEKLTNDPNYIVYLINKIKDYKEQLEQAQPKVELYDTLIELKDVLDMKKSAKILNFYNLGRNRLYEILRWNKVLMKDNEPYQSYFERGWFIIKESIINDRVVVTTYVTNKGLEGIRKLLLKLGYKQRENKG